MFVQQQRQQQTPHPPVEDEQVAADLASEQQLQSPSSSDMQRHSETVRLRSGGVGGSDDVTDNARSGSTQQTANDLGEATLVKVVRDVPGRPGPSVTTADQADSGTWNATVDQVQQQPVAAHFLEEGVSIVLPPVVYDNAVDAADVSSRSKREVEAMEEEQGAAADEAARFFNSHHTYYPYYRPPPCWQYCPYTTIGAGSPAVYPFVVGGVWAPQCLRDNPPTCTCFQPFSYQRPWVRARQSYQPP